MSGRGKFPASFLRHRVVLQQPVETPDGGGGVDISWADVATLWARIEPVALREERLENEQLISKPRYAVTLRTGLAVTAAMRLVHGERIFSILSVNLPVDAREPVRLMAEEG